MARSFALTWDYRCPFARIAVEHVLDGLDAGAPWEVRWVPFSLSQVKHETWDRSHDSGLLALEVAVAVRDTQPAAFLDAHRALFTGRHDLGLDLRDEDAVRATIAAAGVDADEAFATVASGAALARVRDDHRWSASTHQVWGVPTFIAGEQAAFVRLMERPSDAGVPAVDAVERVVDLLEGWPALNEFKHTALPR